MQKLFATIENGETLDPDIAKDVAHAEKWLWIWSHSLYTLVSTTDWFYR